MAHRHKKHHHSEHHEHEHEHHKKHAKGGRVAYTGAGSHVEHEAESTADDFKHGGHAHHHHEGHKKHTRKGHGRGHHKHHHGHHAEGGVAAAAPALKRGGKVGSNHSPFSSAAHSIDHGRTTKNVPRDELNAGHGGHSGKGKK